MFLMSSSLLSLHFWFVLPALASSKHSISKTVTAPNIFKLIRPSSLLNNLIIFHFQISKHEWPNENFHRYIIFSFQSHCYKFDFNICPLRNHMKLILVHKHNKRWTSTVTHSFSKMGWFRLLLQNTAWWSPSCWIANWMRVSNFLFVFRNIVFIIVSWVCKNSSRILSFEDS